jgi:hypothetical protein
MQICTWRKKAITTQSTQDTISVSENELARTVKAMRPMVPARNFETSKRFYEELGFRPES